MKYTIVIEDEPGGEVSVLTACEGLTPGEEIKPNTPAGKLLYLAAKVIRAELSDVREIGA